MLQNVGKSIEVQEQRRKDYEAEIKAFQAETQRISAVAAGMTPDQMQEIVIGTVHAMIDSGDLAIAGDQMRQGVQPEMPPEQMQPMPPEAMQ